MSHPHYIDNESQLFRFDDFEGSAIPRDFPLPIQGTTSGHSSAMSSHDDPLASEESSLGEEDRLVTSGKGKGTTKPMLIRTQLLAVHDLFDLSYPTSTFTTREPNPSMQSPSTSSSSGPPFCSNDNEFLKSFIPENAEDESGADCAINLGKGKGKEVPPTLPPLTFSLDELEYGQTVWPSSIALSPLPGPSSFDSNFGLSTTSTTNATETEGRDQELSTLHAAGAGPLLEVTRPLMKRMPSRRRSLSNLSVHSTRPMAARSMSRMKVKINPSQMPSNLARALLYRRNVEVSPAGIGEPGAADAPEAGTSTPTKPRPTLKVDELDSSAPSPLDFYFQDPSAKPSEVSYYKANTMKHKGRSNSSPFPLSALDYVPWTSADIFTPLPLIVRNYFNEVLPRELQLQVLASLVRLHELDYLRAVEAKQWTLAKATSSKSKWVGREKGIRELIRYSRVSKAWEKLVFDGQLWVDLDLCAFPDIPESVLLRLSLTGGPFITRLGLAGHVQLTSFNFVNITDSLCSTSPSISSLANTQLTAINLQGCSNLNSLSLHYILVRSRFLRKLCLKGLRAVTNTTCDIIATYCPQLASLDLSNCSNLDAKGILRMSSAAMDRREHLLLRELRLCGLKNIDDRTMATLGRAAPFLEILDLSYVRQLHNSALDAFVACGDVGDTENLGVEIVLVTPHDIGREMGEWIRYRRRVTRLRHLSLSSCVLLTDNACSNLAHSVPQLEFLELAGIGADLRDEGLIRLLNTTPLIRRLDLEDASSISDAVIAAVTPAPTEPGPLSYLEAESPQPGHALEQLNISYATHVSDTALRALISGCPRLKSIEVDNTRIGSGVIRDFVYRAKKRETHDARIVAVDCRGISEPFIKELSVNTRPRQGYRAYEARKLMYLDGRDENEDDLKVGQDECDEKRVVLKSFYSWQTVDAVKVSRDKRRKSTFRRAANVSGGSAGLEDRTRWWSPGGRRSRSGRNSPLNMADFNSDSCIVM